MKKIVVIDGQGGRIGQALVKIILERFPDDELVAVGTNCLATMSLLKGGAKQVATGERAVVVAVRDADVIVGPIGIVVADALMGEVTPRMARAVGQSRATRVLIPLNRCQNLVAGLADLSLSELLVDAVNQIEACLQREPS